MRSLRAASIIAVHLYTRCPPVSSLNYNVCKTLPLDLYRAPRFCHITPLLTELHWLNIKHRIDLFWRTRPFMVQLLHISVILFHSNRILNMDRDPMTHYCCSHHPTLGDQAFWAAAPKLWNSLPQELREEHRIGTFKKKLKTYLFKKAYILTNLFIR